MNIPDVNNLRVAVIPTEKDNSITTSSSIEEILACDDLMLYTITDYFVAQNNEELPIHFSFLIDIKTKTNWTGVNINDNPIDKIYFIRIIAIGKSKYNVKRETFFVKNADELKKEIIKFKKKLPFTDYELICNDDVYEYPDDFIDVIDELEIIY